MMIDTHSHLNFKAYKDDLNEIIKRTGEAGIFCIDVGVNYDTSKHAVELAEENKNIFAAIGLHPIYADEKFDEQKYKELAKSKRVVAIGEIGLDAKYPNIKQKQIFLQQLDLAKELNLPVILHCRMAHIDLIKILEKRRGLKGVIHCFTGSWEQAQKYMDLGFYLGINGIIFKMNLDETIKKIPLDKIVVETDCPYLTPPQEKEKRNEPVFIKHVVEKLADLKGINFDKVSDKTTQNARELFNI